MKAHIIKNGYFWFGYTDAITKCIQKCGKWHVEIIYKKYLINQKI